MFPDSIVLVVGTVPPDPQHESAAELIIRALRFAAGTALDGIDVDPVDDARLVRIADTFQHRLDEHRLTAGMLTVPSDAGPIDLPLVEDVR